MPFEYVVVTDGINPSQYPVVVRQLRVDDRIEEYILSVAETQAYLTSLLTDGPPADAADVFNVLDYGVTGDGSSDDTIAIQAALDTAIGGGIVYFPPGTYLTTAQVNIYGSGVTMRGAGPSTIIKAANGANIGHMYYVQSSASDFTAESFVLDGNRDALGTSGIYGACSGIVVVEPDGVTARDLEVKNVSGVGFNLQAATPFRDARLVMERCYIHHNGMLTAKEGNDVFLGQVKNCSFTDCLFAHGYGTGGGGLYAGGGISGSYTHTRHVNCVFRDNFNGGGQTGGQSVAGAENYWTFTNCLFELTVPDPHDTSGIEVGGSHVTIDACQFLNHDAGSAIALHGDLSGIFPDAGNVTVSNCDFSGNLHGIEHADTGDIANLLFVNNRFQDTDKGILIGQSVNSVATNVTIIGNDLSDVATTPITATNVVNLVQLGNLPDTVTNAIRDVTVSGDATITGDVRIGTNPGVTSTFGAIGVPNGLDGAIMARNAANSGDFALMHPGGDDRIYLYNAHSFSASDAAISGYLSITDGVTAPSTVAGRAQLYVDTADGDLKVKFGDGTVKTIVVDT